MKGISSQAAPPASLPILQFKAREHSYFPGKIKKRKFSPLTISPPFYSSLSLSEILCRSQYQLPIRWFNIDSLTFYSVFHSSMGMRWVVRENVCFSRARRLHRPVIKPIITIWNKGPWVSLQEPPPSGLSQPPERGSLSPRRKQTLSLGSWKRGLNGCY